MRSDSEVLAAGAPRAWRHGAQRERGGSGPGPGAARPRPARTAGRAARRCTLH